MMHRNRWTETTLTEGHMRRVRFEYYVTGRGRFPFDMLRLDQCWPVDGFDAEKLINDGFNAPDFRSILLRSYRQPTVDRWSSFLWSCGVEKLD